MLSWIACFLIESALEGDKHKFDLAKYGNYDVLPQYLLALPTVYANIGNKDAPRN